MPTLLQFFGIGPLAETMTLIAGRTSKQGTTLNAGKLKADYIQVTSTVEMNAEDMERLGLAEGDKVRVRSSVGETVLTCLGRKPEDLPSGLLFVAYGPPTSQLMGSDTALTGMPLSKNLEVEVEPLAKGS